jgi:hypothetical protein
MKYGGPGSDGKLHWYISGRSGYSTPFNANVWHNGAYEIVRGLPPDWRGRTLMLTLAEFLQQGSLVLVLDRRRAPEASDAAGKGRRLLGAPNFPVWFDEAILTGGRTGKTFTWAC